MADPEAGRAWPPRPVAAGLRRRDPRRSPPARWRTLRHRAPRAAGVPRRPPPPAHRPQAWPPQGRQGPLPTHRHPQDVSSGDLERRPGRRGRDSWTTDNGPRTKGETHSSFVPAAPRRRSWTGAFARIPVCVASFLPCGAGAPEACLILLKRSVRKRSPHPPPSPIGRRRRGNCRRPGSSAQVLCHRERERIAGEERSEDAQRGGSAPA